MCSVRLQALEDRQTRLDNVGRGRAVLRQPSPPFSKPAFLGLPVFELTGIKY